MDCINGRFLTVIMWDTVTKGVGVDGTWDLSALFLASAWVPSCLKMKSWIEMMYYLILKMGIEISGCPSSFQGTCKHERGTYTHARVCIKHLKCCSAYNKHSAHFSWYHSNRAGQTSIQVLADPHCMSCFWCILQTPVTVSWINNFFNRLHQPSENMRQ